MPIRDFKQLTHKHNFIEMHGSTADGVRWRKEENDEEDDYDED